MKSLCDLCPEMSWGSYISPNSVKNNSFQLIFLIFYLIKTVFVSEVRHFLRHKRSIVRVTDRLPSRLLNQLRLSTTREGARGSSHFQVCRNVLVLLYERMENSRRIGQRLDEWGSYLLTILFQQVTSHSLTCIPYY